MLAELAIANAAFQVIKQTLSNGKDILDAGDSLGKYFKAESDINKEVEAKGKHNVLEMYQAQITLRKNEEELKFMLDKQEIQGYYNFIQFKAQYARDQKEAAKEEARAKYKRAVKFEKDLTIAIKVFGAILFTVAAILGTAIYIKGL